MARPKTQYLVTILEQGASLPDIESIAEDLPNGLEEVARIVKSEEGEQTSVVQLWKKVGIKVQREVVVNVRLNGHKRRKKSRGHAEE